MFEVHCCSDLDEEWENRDEELSKLAGSRGSAIYSSRDVVRTWLMKSFQHAQRLKARLETVGGARVSIKEVTS